MCKDEQNVQKHLRFDSRLSADTDYKKTRYVKCTLFSREDPTDKIFLLKVL